MITNEDAKRIIEMSQRGWITDEYLDAYGGLGNQQLARMTSHRNLASPSYTQDEHRRLVKDTSDHVLERLSQKFSQKLDNINVDSIPTKTENSFTLFQDKVEKYKRIVDAKRRPIVSAPTQVYSEEQVAQISRLNDFVTQLKYQEEEKEILPWFKLLIQLGAELRLMEWDTVETIKPETKEKYKVRISKFLEHLANIRARVVLSNAQEGIVLAHDGNFQIKLNNGEFPLNFTQIIRIVEVKQVIT